MMLVIDMKYNLMYYLVMKHAPEFVYLEEHQQVGNLSAHLAHKLDHRCHHHYIIIIFLIPTSCTGALWFVNHRPLAYMGLSSLGCGRWHLYIFGSHATQLASHPLIGCQHLLQPCSCQMRSGYISFRV